jgi:hypothetical protein
MKKTLLSLTLLLGLHFAVQAQSSLPPVPPDSCRIIFMRSTGYQGSLGAFTAFIDDQLVCRLNNKRYSMHLVAPGDHTVSAQFAGKKSKEKAERVSMRTEGGKTYYVQFIINTGMFVNNLYCQEVTENSARLILPSLKEDTNCQ